MVFLNVTDKSLDVSELLQWNTTYYWRVDMMDGDSVVYSSAVWLFVTDDYVCQENIVGDVNGDCVVDLADLAIVAGSWLVESSKIPKNS